MLDQAAWIVFFGGAPLLWASGLWLFARANLAPGRKALWAVLLVAVGIAVGVLLPLVAIRNRFLIVLAILPLIAVADVWLARSNRSFLFWLRACGFEVCTVFLCAALTRLAIGLR